MLSSVSFVKILKLRGMPQTHVASIGEEIHRPNSGS